jgi:hypothetical protein
MSKAVNAAEKGFFIYRIPWIGTGETKAGREGRTEGLMALCSEGQRTEDGVAAMLLVEGLKVERAGGFEGLS